MNEAGKVEAGYPPAGRAWWGVGVMSALYCLSLLDRQILVLLIPPIRAELGISDFQVGMLQGLAFSIFYIFFGLLLGWAVDRSSRKAIIYLGVTFWSLATAACGLAGNTFQLMLARFGVGAGEAALAPASYSIISDSFPKHRLSLVMSVFGIGSHIGTGLSLLLGGYLIATIPASGVAVPGLGMLSAWRMVFLCAGLPGIAIALLILTVKDPPRRDRVTTGDVSQRAVFAYMRARWRFYTGHFVGFGLMSLAGFGYNSWAAVYLMRNLHVDVGQVVAILAPIAIIGGIVGSMLAGIVADRLYARGIRDAHLRVFIVLAPLGAVFMLLAMSTTHLGWFMLWATCIGLTLGFVGVAPAALQLVTPNEFRGRVSAAFSFVLTLLGAGIGPVAVGALSTFVFRDDGMLGWAIAANALVAMPLAMLAFWSALKPMRTAVHDAQAWSGGSARDVPGA